MRIIFTDESLEYFNELSKTLYEKGYFGFRANAVKYVNNLLDDIRDNLPYKVQKPAPPYFDKYGNKLLYSTFRKSKTTQWYIFYNIYKYRNDIVYVIRFISNNHILAQRMI